jgi:hypothetical protein
MTPGGLEPRCVATSTFRVANDGEVIVIHEAGVLTLEVVQGAKELKDFANSEAQLWLELWYCEDAFR